MSSIKYNHLTNEIEMEGSESFIESNSNKIQCLLDESFGVKEKMASRERETNREPIPFMRLKEPQPCAEIKKHEQPEAFPISQVMEASTVRMTHELRPKRPPVRKYIRKVGIPGNERIVVEVVEQKPKEISIASLKEKFGLSESKIGGISRDAEKLAKIKRVMNGSYEWPQD